MPTIIEKTAVVHFSKRHTRLVQPLTLFGMQLQFSSQARYLGVDLDRTLLFQSHLKTTARKALNRLLALYPLFRSREITIEAKINIYKMMIRSILTYAAPAWQHAAMTHHLQLQRVQNRAARMITGHSRDTRIAQLHEDLSLPMLTDVIKLQCQLFWNRIIHSPNPSLHSIGTANPIRHIHRMPHPS